MFAVVSPAAGNSCSVRTDAHKKLYLSVFTATANRAGSVTDALHHFSS